VVNRQCAHRHRFVPISRQVFTKAAASLGLKPTIGPILPKPTTRAGLPTKIANDKGRYRPVKVQVRLAFSSTSLFTNPYCECPSARRAASRTANCCLHDEMGDTCLMLNFQISSEFVAITGRPKARTQNFTIWRKNAAEISSFAGIRISAFAEGSYVSP
jgi:hypothetical protein